MDNLQKINAIPFLELFSKLGIQTVKDSVTHEYKIQVPGDTRISNGSYKLNEIKNIVFANGSTRPQGTVFQFMTQHLGAQYDRQVFAWFEENFNIISDVSEVKTKINTPKKRILDDFPTFQIGELDNRKLGAVRTWLVNRGFSQDFVGSEEGTNRISEVFSGLGFCENPTTRKDADDNWIPSKPVLAFPMMDAQGTITGIKMRKINNKPEDENSNDSKSINVSGGKSGVIYASKKIIQDSKQVIIVEGEPDYIILRMLGFDNVIGNLGGVGACRDIIRELTKDIPTVIVAYDNDEPGKKGAQKLMEYCKRQMFRIQYPDRKNEHGEAYKDINEFFEAGYTREDFEKMLTTGSEIKEDKDGRGEYNNKDSKVILTMANDNPFIYLRKNYEYYDIYENKIVRKEQVMDWMGIDGKQLKEMLAGGAIRKYYDVCYWKGGKKDHYNVLDERILARPSETPMLDDSIRFLIGNLCNWNQDNIDWLHKAILYKYTHINDVLVPAVLFKGVGGSGKGTFIKLLSRIFSQENVMQGLGTQSLTSDFCPYTGNRIIVEINELGGGNNKDAVRILDRLKSLVFEPRIMVNMKGIQPRECDNVAWFILSSNHSKPLQLDSGTSGNRRFTVINTGPGIELAKGRKINESISKAGVVEDYLAWLMAEYPETTEAREYSALENEDKDLLTTQSESYVDHFFAWFSRKFPKISKITARERNTLLEMFRFENGEDGFDFNKKYSLEWFNAALPHHVQYKKVSIRGEAKQGYHIKETVLGPNDTGYFENNKYEEPNLYFQAIPEK